MINLKSKITQEIFSYFFLHENNAAYVNELARRLKLDSGNLTRKLIELERSGILKSEFQGNQRHYSLNLSFPLINEYRQLTLKSVGLEFLLNEALKQVPGIKKAFLYGSYTDKTMDNSSDIDLLVIGEHKPLDVIRSIASIQKKSDREINVINLTEQEFKQRKQSDPFVRTIIKKNKIAVI